MFMTSAVILFACLPAAEETVDRPVQAKPATSCSAPPEENLLPAWTNPWFFLFTVENVYPRLESEKMVSYYDHSMRFMAPGFKDVRTVSGLRNAHILCIGRSCMAIFSCRCNKYEIFP